MPHDAMQLLASSVDDLVFLWRPTGQMIWVNPAFVRVTGMTAEDFAFRTAENPFVHPDDTTRVVAHLTAFASSTARVSEPIENRFFDIWGGLLTVMTTVHRVPWEGEEVFLSVTKVRPPADAVEPEGWYRRVVEAASDGIFLVTAEGRVIFSNRRFHELTGLPAVEVAKTLLPSLMRDEHVSAASTALQHIVGGQRITTFSGRLRQSGRWLEVTLTGLDARDRPAVALAVGRDVTDAREAAHALALSENQLRHAQKLESVGRLAGGVAHDFNNLLTVISGNTTVALRELGPHHPAREYLVDVEQAATSAAAVTRQLLAFSRKEILEPRMLDLGDTLRKLQKLLYRLIPENIELAIEPAPGSLDVVMDDGQLEQLIVNLVINARDAMPSGGRLSITTGTTTVDTTRAQRLGLAAGPYVSVAVTDTGVGMSDEVLARLFEPFFTTKERGTGLGLAMAREAMTKAGGAIEVRSRERAGSSFELLFEPAPGTTAAQGRTDVMGTTGGAERIVVVEDEPSVRRLMVRVLEQLGYRVHDFGGGAPALEFLAGPHDVTLLLTDVVMPGMGGRELAEQALQLRPGLRVLFCSGYTSDVVLRQGITNQNYHFIEKPFTPALLAARVRDLLDAPPTSR